MPIRHRKNLIKEADEFIIEFNKEIKKIKNK